MVPPVFDATVDGAVFEEGDQDFGELFFLGDDGDQVSHIGELPDLLLLPVVEVELIEGLVLVLVEFAN